MKKRKANKIIHEKASAAGAAPIRSMQERVYLDIPIDSIKVINSRNRDMEKFKDNVRSIKNVGQYKPIIINKRRLTKTGFYELVCGEGRLNAHRQLGKTLIRAEVVDIPPKLAHLMTLGENIARNPMATSEFAMILGQMRDEGMHLEEISTICGRSVAYISKIITLVKKGETRLVKGVEDGILPLDFACSVAESDNRSIQHLLIDAFDSGLVRASNVVAVRKLIEERVGLDKQVASAQKEGKPMTLEQLRKEIISTTRKKEDFVHQANTKMNRIMAIVMQLETLSQDKVFVELAEMNGLVNLPLLSGPYQPI